MLGPSWYMLVPKFIYKISKKNPFLSFELIDCPICLILLLPSSADDDIGRRGKHRFCRESNNA